MAPLMIDLGAALSWQEDIAAVLCSGGVSLLCFNGGLGLLEAFSGLLEMSKTQVC